MTSEATPDTQRSDVVAVHDLHGQRIPRFTVTCVAPLSAYAAIVLPEARRALHGSILTALPSAPVASVHAMTSV